MAEPEVVVANREHRGWLLAEVARLEATTRQDAANVLGRLPLVAHNVIKFEVMELHPFAALSVLFGEQR